MGWLPMQGRDWSIGLEAADHAALYRSGEGVRRALSLGGVIQLHWAAFSGLEPGAD